jgi:hypothetical protein
MKNEEINEAASFYAFLSKIGNGIQQLINKILQSIVYSFLLLFHIIKKRILIIAAASIIGILIQGYYFISSGANYQSSFVGKFSFQSGQLLYKITNDVNELIKRNEHAEISKLLQITIEDAKKLSEIELKPITNSNEEAKLYRDYIREVDTTITRPMSPKEYITTYPKYLYPQQEIVLVSNGKINYANIEKGLLNLINNNPYLIQIKNILIENANQQINQYSKNNLMLDSLAMVKIRYYRLMAMKDNANQSNIIVGDHAGGNNQNEQWIFDNIISNKIQEGNLKNSIEQLRDICISLTHCHAGTRVSFLKSNMGWPLKGLLLGLLLSFGMEIYVYIDKKQKALFKNA